MPRSHRQLLVAWGIVFVMAAIGWAVPIVALAVVPFFAVMVLGVITYRAVKRPADLARRITYHVLIGLLLVTSALTAILSGATLFISSAGPLPVVGLTALGAANVAIAILTWRALVRPSPRRAALAGMVAVMAESTTMMVDVAMNMHVREFGSQPETGFALLAALLSIITGSLACIAALVAFGPDLPDLPHARVVAEDARP